ncbi:hypothetical protein [Paenibacillus eucommiae]|uniref:Uncharacterized protein n=1 Tax=Paenibacillus eucommiae TaxID=1355755 RepID=A0ABS4IMB2_9BACL|nr:hypothetical protein [Paenibacillus eucommiae]MBP1988669.1 hypothetical protein [Paenibacillus eucommiae]
MSIIPKSLHRILSLIAGAFFIYKGVVGLVSGELSLMSRTGLRYAPLNEDEVFKFSILFILIGVLGIFLPVRDFMKNHKKKD